MARLNNKEKQLRLDGSAEEETEQKKEQKKQKNYKNGFEKSQKNYPNLESSGPSNMTKKERNMKRKRLLKKIGSYIDMPGVYGNHFDYLQIGNSRVEYISHYGTVYFVFKRGVPDKAYFQSDNNPRLYWKRVGHPISTSNLQYVAKRFKRFVMQEAL